MTKREKCKKRVYSGARYDFSGHQCSRYARRDGYCNQHHPDEVRKRNDESMRRHEEKWAFQKQQRIRTALRDATLEQLQAEIARRTT